MIDRPTLKDWIEGIIFFAFVGVLGWTLLALFGGAS